MCNVAFYYLLRSAEYTHTGKKQQTTPLCLCDITFWCNTRALPAWADASTISTATAATLNLRSQKNGEKDTPVYLTASHTPHCPVRALTRIAAYILQHIKDRNTPVYTYWNPKGDTRKVHATDITQAIRTAATDMTLDQYGIAIAQVSSHSLRSAGAMALHLAGVPAHTIRLMGRWKSDAFLSYLHTQLSCFTEGLSSLMSTSHTFTNVARVPSSKGG